VDKGLNSILAHKLENSQSGDKEKKLPTFPPLSELFTGYYPDIPSLPTG
jgi:hypothetical protein